MRRSFVVAVLLAASAITAGPATQATGAAQPPGNAADGAHVRVNQVGYPADGPKRAYLMSSTAQPGAPFAVRDAAGTTVLTGTAGASLGSWSSAYPAVHPIDFDVLTTPGTYTITTSGAISATSPRVTIASGASLYATPIANALSYYQVQRDGPDYLPSALRTAPGHLNDRNAMTYLTPRHNSSGRFSGDLTPTGVRIDASGGWSDAGDYLKFLHGASYTADMLLLGVRDFPAMRDFEAEARFGNDWLLKMWDDTNGVLYYQVGIGSGNAKTYGDHDVWRLPQDDDTYGGTDPRYRYLRNRPVFRSNAPGELISPNLAGRVAAAFALCYQIWRTTDPAYANSCLAKGQHVFDLANPNPSKLVSVIPYSFYPEVEWRDDMELGAAELARALQAGTPPAGLPHRDPAFYLQRAAHWANAYITGPNGAEDTLNLYDVAGVAHYELHRAITTHGSDSGLATNRAALVADLKKALDTALAQAASDPFGFGFPWSTWDTTSHGAGLSVMAAEYDALTGTDTYGRYANRWLGNILGANAWGSSFIIGTGQVWPHCPHHQLANLMGSLDGTAPQLVGAAVEGPNSITGRGSVSGTRACPPDGGDRFGGFDGSGAKFLDNVESYPTIEPAIDLTAASPLAFAWQTAPGTAAVPTYSLGE
ncbi:MAG: glycoside hydrolase family 9 protein [Micromonosporaceae bacterium]